jgi:sugar phosphate isomerase/epimerase
VTIGLSTYAYFWRLSDRAAAPLSLADVVTDAAKTGVDLVQICDHPAIERYSPTELSELRAIADAAGVRFELGTRGLEPRHLRPYLELAGELGVTLLRSMVNAADSRPSPAEALRYLDAVLPELAERDMTLALETYEQVPTATLVDIVAAADDPRIGICLDPANTVAALEDPRQVVKQTAPHVKNIHVKDFAFARSPGWVGFQLTGAPLGEGLLDYGHLTGAVRPEERGINEVVEHWLPWQGNADDTCRLEARWTTHNLERLRSRRS